MLTASDTAVSWWRSLTISWALDHASERAFQEWAEDPTHRWLAEDRESLNLFAAELNADIAGEHGTWRAVSQLVARHRLMRAHSSDDELQALTDGLDGLRRSGDPASLKLAVRHLKWAGPVDAIAEAVGKITEDNWTHTTAKSNFDFLAAAGDLVDVDRATAFVAWCVSVFRGQETEFIERVRPAFIVELAVAEAVKGLLPAAAALAHQQVAKLLASQPEPVPPVLDQPLSSWVNELEYEALSRDTTDALQKLGRRDQGEVGATVLGWLAEHGHHKAKEEVLARVARGDLNALSAMGDVRVLNHAEAEALIINFEGLVLHTVEQATVSAYGMGRFDGGRWLALFNLWFPDVARWEPLLGLLTDPRVAAENKRGACEIIVELSGRLPDEVRFKLSDNIDSVAKAPAIELPGSRSMGGLAVAVGVAVGALSGSSADTAVAQLALGSIEDRRDAADLLGGGQCERMRPLLASLVGDRRPEVRSMAAHAIGRLARTVPDDVVLALAQVVANDNGVVIPSALIAGLSRGDAVSDFAHELTEGLSTHRSALVRQMAHRLLRRI